MSKQFKNRVEQATAEKSVKGGSNEKTILSSFDRSRSCMPVFCRSF
jgi:hypothetical protein